MLVFYSKHDHKNHSGFETRVEVFTLRVFFSASLNFFLLSLFSLVCVCLCLNFFQHL